MPFASSEDVEARLGRPLTSQDAAMAAALLDAATAVIAQAAGRDDQWAQTLSPAPDVIRYLTVELAVRVMTNPDGARSVSEQLGAYQHAQSFHDTAAGGGLLLTKTEELLVRRVVVGAVSGSATTRSILDPDPEPEPVEGSP